MISVFPAVALFPVLAFTLPLFPKLLILVAVFWILVIVMRGQGIYEKLIIYTLVILALIFALSRFAG